MSETIRLLDTDRISATDWIRLQERPITPQDSALAHTLKRRLGLPNDASDDVIVAAVVVLQKRAMQQQLAENLEWFRNRDAAAVGGNFVERARQLAEERGLSEAEAFHEVAREHPEAYRAYRNGTFIDGRLPA